MTYDGRHPEPPYTTECEECEQLRAEVEALRAMKKCAVSGCGLYEGKDMATLRAKVEELSSLLREVQAYVVCSPLLDELHKRINAAIRREEEE